MRKQIYYSCSILITVVLFVFLGCSNVTQGSPSEVVKITYKLGNEGKYTETEQYLSADVLMAVKNQKIAPLKKTWDYYTRNGSLEKIEVLEENIRGEGADVKFRLHFKDGKSKDKSEPLIKENGKWKITID